MFHKGLHFFLPHSSAKVVDAEAQSLDQDLDVLKENDGILTLDLPDTPVSDLEAPSIKWLLETSTDPEAFLAASRLVPQVEWPLDFDISDILPLMYDSFTSCVDIQGKIVPSLGDKASACAMALTHLYYRRFLRAYPTPGEFIVRGEADVDVLVRIYRSSMLPADKTVLDTAINPDFSWWSVTWPETCPDSVLQRLSHLLPYHFVTERVSGDIENLAIKVISNLLSSPSSPSNLVVANCTLLACLMVGIQVDKKDIVRIDKRCHRFIW
ncbi:uncharacterized protein EDB93DRAFT_307437 [Suillus bovinus]|uniref:uncharacterized protein n=1 Tax=Suillus bovinus TaxID=48563 RepID=UPI001B866E6A|nr:uncharacterized protein EDB93DRAFT_307437 [Suillus bovinus]KAG2151237.1 hypothetical protein EDB93DRAFT_307437 [Suillus bovinus]